MKILIVHKNWIGDVLFQIPAIEAVRRHYPDADIVCLAPGRCREVLSAHPAVNRVIVFDEKNEHRTFFSKIRFVLDLRKEKWDKAYLLQRSRTRSALLWAGGVKEITGYQSGRRFFLTTAIPEPKMPMHQVDYFLHLLKQTGMEVSKDARYRFYVSEKARQSARELLNKHGIIDKSFICFHLGANWEPKRWPVRHFAVLADMIAEEWNIPVVVTGSANDLSLFVQFRRWVKQAKVVSLIGETGLEVLGAIFERASALVTGDSGPMHIGSGVGTSTAALFGPTDANLTGPRGIGDKIVLSYVPKGYSVPWYGKNFPESGWLSYITPEEVLRALKEKKWLKRSEAGAGAAKTAVSNSGGNKDSSKQRILFVTLSNIGDVILTTPVLMALRAEFPDARVTAVCGPRAESLLRGSRHIDRLIIYDKKKKIFDQFGFLKELRAESYDITVDLRNSAIPFLVSTQKRSPVFRRLTAVNRKARHLEVLRQMNFKSEPLETFDFFSKQDSERMLEKLKEENVDEKSDWILIAPVAASGLKTWPLEKYKQVVAELLKEYSSQILIVGDARERELSASLKDINPSRIRNLSGKLTLRESAALVSRAQLLITNDSAVMHLGFELNRPVVAVFGPTNPEKYAQTGPLFRVVRQEMPCSPCEKPVCRFERQHCFEDLDPKTVVQACKELLSEVTAAV